MRYKDNRAKATTWFNLFADVDEDGSGYITFDEFENVARRKLGAKGGWAWAELRLSGAWPDGRNGHSFHIVNSSCMLVFGGAAGFGDDRGNTNALLLVRPNRLVPAHELPRDGAGGWSGDGDDDEDDGPQLLSLDDDRDGGDGAPPGDVGLRGEPRLLRVVPEEMATGAIGEGEAAVARAGNAWRSTSFSGELWISGASSCIHCLHANASCASRFIGGPPCRPSANVCFDRPCTKTSDLSG